MDVLRCSEQILDSAGKVACVNSSARPPPALVARLVVRALPEVVELQRVEPQHVDHVLRRDVEDLVVVRARLEHEYLAPVRRRGVRAAEVRVREHVVGAHTLALLRQRANTVGLM